MSLHFNGSVSKDFPLFHSNIIPIYINKEKHSKKPYKNRFILTNEHPDFFKLEGMKEEGYKNPYLNEVIKFDRNETYKNIDFARRQLNLINFIKFFFFINYKRNLTTPSQHISFLDFLDFSQFKFPPK